MLSRIRDLFTRPKSPATAAEPDAASVLYCGRCDRTTERQPTETVAELAARHRATCPGHRPHARRRTPRPAPRPATPTPTRAGTPTPTDTSAATTAAVAATTAASAASTAATCAAITCM